MRSLHPANARVEGKNTDTHGYERSTQAHSTVGVWQAHSHAHSGEPVPNSSNAVGCSKHTDVLEMAKYFKNSYALGCRVTADGVPEVEQQREKSKLIEEWQQGTCIRTQHKLNDTSNKSAQRLRGALYRQTALKCVKNLM